MKATSSAIKSFLTRRHDRFRPPYGKHTIRLPRQCVFAGTINPTAGGYLKDPTGARRLDEEQAIAVRELDATAYFAL
jgi:predicted P-loop ATPase